MKHAASVALLVSVTCLAGTAEAAPPDAAPPAPQAEPAPATPAKPTPARAMKKAPRPSFWLAAEPHVPLAIVEGKNIRSIARHGRTCGAPSRWAKPKSRWKAVDAWGQVTGLFEVAGSEMITTTGCREVGLMARSGKDGVGIFVADDSPYSPVASAAWTPGKEQAHGFEKLVKTIEDAWVDGKPAGKALPFAERALYFDLAPIEAKKDEVAKDKAIAKAEPKGKGEAKGKAEAKAKKPAKAVEKAGKGAKAHGHKGDEIGWFGGDTPRRWAVAGGPILVVGYLNDEGQWKVASVKSPVGLADSYRPIAVFDLNGDKVPEIVYASSDGLSSSDVVLSLDAEKLIWEDAAKSPGGSRL